MRIKIKQCIFIFLTTMIVLVSQTSHALNDVQILETYPVGKDITLNRNQNFYLHFRYHSDQPIRIWAEPYFQGKPANAGNNPSSVYSGTGEALGWFFFQKPNDRVDEIRVNVGDGSKNGTHVAVIYPVNVISSDQPAVTSTDPEWVMRLNARDRDIQQRNELKQMNTPTPIGEQVLLSGFILFMLLTGCLGVAAPLWGFWRWHDGWRIATMVPLTLMLFMIGRIIIDTSRDPTTHNLWPFELLQGGVLSVIYMAILLIIRKVTGANKT